MRRREDKIVDRVSNKLSRRALKLCCLILPIAVLSISIFVSCDDTLDIEQNYTYTVTTMPVVSDLIKGETAEIRCNIVESGHWDGTEYYIRYFQSKGEGILQDENGTIFTPNDSFKIDSTTFRLYYTSASTKAQELEVTFFNNFSSEVKLEFSFSNESEEETTP